jgi:hypothetical protein
MQQRWNTEPRRDALPYFERGHSTPTAFNVGDVGLDQSDEVTQLGLAQTGELPVGAEDLAPVFACDR